MRFDLVFSNDYNGLLECQIIYFKGDIVLTSWALLGCILVDYSTK